MSELFDEIKRELEITPVGGAGPVFQRYQAAGMLFWEFNKAAPGARVVFTTRPGGVSQPPYDSLNLGFHVGDAAENVIENRRLISAAFGLAPELVTSPVQRHTAQARRLDREDQAGTGSGPPDRSGKTSPFDPCDGLVTRLKRVPLLLLFADCVPVVLTGRSAEGPLVAVIHAGRKGLVDGIVKNAVTLAARFIEPPHLTAAIGAAIGSCCYEVDQASASEFEERFGAAAAEGRFLDLRYAARKELTAAGLAPENIYTLELCTACDDSFFSHRRDGVTGRHGAIAWIE